MKKSGGRLIETLVSRRRKNKGVFEWYLYNPIIPDLLLGVIGIIGYKILKAALGQVFSVERSSLEDILNELISSSLGAGGFILAAFAIIASIQMTVPKLGEGEQPKSGREYLFNHPKYASIIRIYTVSCIVMVSMFLLFSITRGLANDIRYTNLVFILIFGSTAVASAFLRCILILWEIIKVKA